MTAIDTSQFGQMIRKFRLAAALSQEELAERSGISARAVSDLERGLRSAPRPETVRMLADGLELEGVDRALFLAAARPESLGPPARADSGSTTGRSERTTVVPLNLQPLPVPPTRLIGREQIVDQVSALLGSDDGRLITLVGPGGVGKTRLGLAIAGAVSFNFAEGAALVDFSPIVQADQVPGAIAKALGIATETGETPLDSLRLSLQNRSLLLVLDNLEHLLESASVVSELLASCPRLRVLVTSRARLRLRGEHVLHVDPLEIPILPVNDSPASLEALAANPAMRLFLDRAQEAAFDFALTDQNAQPIRDICRRLDGLPLAIELAAARIGPLSPTALLARLEHSLGILTEGARDAPGRQQTLRATIAWSYDLLSPAEQAFFRKASIFVGSFTLEAAEAVAIEEGDDALGIVSSLVEKNLIRQNENADGEVRFSMLETIREFGLELLGEDGEERHTRDRHFDCYLRLSRDFDNAFLTAQDEIRWIAHMDLEAENVRSALRWARGNGDLAAVILLLTAASISYWTSRPHDQEIAQIVSEGLASEPPVPTDALVRAHFLAAWQAGETGDFERAFAHAAASLNAASASGAPEDVGLALLVLGIASEWSGDCERSTAAHRESLAAFRKTPSLEVLVAFASEELGHKLLLCGDVEEGVRLIDEAIQIHQRLGSVNGMSMATGMRGNAARIQGDAILARRLFRQSIELSERLGDRAFVLGAVVGVAGVELMETRPEQAARMLGSVDAARESLGLKRVAHPLHSRQIVTAVRERLGEDQYQALYLEGRSIPYDQLIADALASPRPDA
jgi:predicted ATPase/transcriptional regulator with XRE-family HTH domain